VRVKTAKRRTPQSTRWLERHLNDPYVAAARAQGYRSRAAFKLKELDEQFSMLAGVERVVDLGAAPGGLALEEGDALFKVAYREQVQVLLQGQVQGVTPAATRRFSFLGHGPLRRSPGRADA
jgi:hypothetical protein